MATRKITTRLTTATLATLIPIAALAGNPSHADATSAVSLSLPPGSSATGANGSIETMEAQPWFSGRVPASVRSKLSSSFETAQRQLEEHAPCRDLFTELGADGRQMLSNTLYYPASLKLERQICSRAYGFTTVGAAPTFLCRRFSKLSDRRAASVLIHEALHHAGLGEWPQDPGGLTPAAIDDLVEEACGL